MALWSHNLGSGRMPMPSYDRERQVASAAAVLAAEAIRERYGGEQIVQYKGPLEPVTEADMVADRILRRDLMAAFPDDGWLSEESTDDGERLSCSRVWIVDPLDGTREFVAGRAEFMVSVALVVDGAPVVGVIVNPITGQVWSAARGAGATLDGKAIRVSSVADLSAAEVVVSRSETRRGMLEVYADTLEMRPSGGAANKLVQIADGRSEGTFTTENRNEWDIAGGLIILTEAGGRVTRPDGSDFVFNRPSPLLCGVVASNGALHQTLLDTVALKGADEPG